VDWALKVRQQPNRIKNKNRGFLRLPASRITAHLRDGYHLTGVWHLR
jgi:hypothetical protein